MQIPPRANPVGRPGRRQASTGGFREHVYVAIPLCIVLIAFCWMVTDGDFALFDAENFGQFYDGQAASLLAGHWDVPLPAISPEEYLHRGKFYGYFGFVPALPRMALNAFWPTMAGSWSRTSLLCGCAVTLCCCYALLLRARRWLGVVGPLARREKIAYGFFLILAGLGSTTIYLGSRAFIYHEAIMWAVAWALAAFDQLLGYLMDGRLVRLAAACLLTFLCFFCRISTGCGPLFSLLLICLNIVAWHVPDRWTGILPPAKIFRGLTRWRTPPPLIHAGFAGMTTLAVAVAFVAVNHAKFGTFFDVSPMREYAMMAAEPGRYERSGGKWLRPGNVPTVLLAYTSMDAIAFDRSFPWIRLQRELVRLPGSHMDGAGGYSSVATALPVFVILAFASGGVLSRRRRAMAESSDQPPSNSASLSIVVLGSIAGLAPVLAFCAVDNRYLHEFIPLLILLSAFGVRALFTPRPTTTLKRLIPFLLIALGLLQIYVNCSFALVYQRSEVFGVPPQPRAQMLSWQRRIDGSLKSLFHLR
ncbi:MAG TPA: hypothetical protein VG326_06255 [Tepidisphaeraceae bacterium]|nr:hypothetical protein [Tepidisphaeraceae bacterium]